MNITRRVRTAAASVAIVGGIAAPVIGQYAPQEPAAQQAPATCTAHVRVFEDGTWSGAEVTAADGTQIAARWEPVWEEFRGVRSDAQGVTTLYTSFPAEVNGQVCTSVIS